MLTEDMISALRGMHPHEAASALLLGKLGPLVAMPAEPHVAALAYLIHLAFRAARRHGEMLSGRPSYEAEETLRNRVLSVAECSGTLRGFGHELFERLRLSLTGLPPRDALWWMQVREAYADRWLELAEVRVLTEACTLARLLDDWMYAVFKAKEAAK